MDLSKLKLEYRNTLFYKKYLYSARMKVPGIYWFIRKSHNLKQYEDKYQLAKRWISYSPYKDEQVQIIIDIIAKSKKDDSFVVRIDNNNVSLYSNDLSKIEAIVNSLGVKASYFKAELMGKGVIKFKTTPPAKYRIFFKNGTTTIEEKRALWKYIEANPEIKPSPSTKEWLQREYSWSPRVWVKSAYHLNLDSEKIMTYLYLRYPDILGENYKLEKAV